MRVIIVNLEKGLPTVEEARQRLLAALDAAKSKRAAVVKLIHGYGSTGQGGILRPAIRRSLGRRRSEGVIRLFVCGENWTPFDARARAVLDACPEMKTDRDLLSCNPGITIVLL